MGEMPKGARQFSSREFNQNTGEAKKAAQNGPVFITDRGEAAYVLMTIEAFEELNGDQRSIVDILADPDATDVTLAIPAREQRHTPIDIE